MKRQTKLTSQEQTQQTSHEQTQQRTALEFATPEELLRHDAIHTPVPPRIAERLQSSARDIPPAPARPWWQRFLGGTNR